VKLSEADVLAQTESAIRAALQGVSALDVTALRAPDGGDGARPGLAVRATSPKGRDVLVFEVKSSGEPRLARAAINQLLQYRHEHENVYGVFVAPYVSPRAADLCQAQGIGYLDLSGNCRLSFGGIFIEREGKPNKFAARRGLGTLYSTKASRVLRVLLTEPGTCWRVTALAEMAGVSLGLVSNVKKLLGDREWLREEERGFAVAQPLDLLTEWSHNYSFRRNEARDYYCLSPAAEVEPALATLCSSRAVRYALTGFSAGARMAPAVRYQRVVAYVDGPANDIARELGLREVASGANVTLLRPYDAGVFFGAREFDGIQTVSAIQAYLDLAAFRGRGEEAAAAILREAIKPRW